MAANLDEAQMSYEPKVLQEKVIASFNREQKNDKRRKKRTSMIINLVNCKYDSVRRVAKRFGMKVCNDEDSDWTIYWTDTVLPEKLLEMKVYQKVNHFPGMNEICRKDLLCRNMNRMYKLFPKEYNCFPRTWTLPADFGDFQTFFQTKKNKIYISKPGSGCQGKGIFLFKSLKEIKSTEHQVCQQYISKPLLIDGFKFDLRIYILITSCDPMKVYVYKDGLTRLGTLKYKEPTGSNMNEYCMHLTNYAINKHSKDFVRDEEAGSKRRITVINKWFIDNGYNIDKIWGDIDDVIIKTLIAAHPVVKHNYRSSFPNHVRGSACFEILGFDVLLDRKLKPWLIEVNRSPSFHTDAPLDKEIKEGLLMDTLNLIDLYANDRKQCMEDERRRVRERLLYKQRSKETDILDDVRSKYEANFEEYEQKHLGGFRRIYPKSGNGEKYKKFFEQDITLCAGTIASRARADLAKQLREELEVKQKEMDRLLRRDKSGCAKGDHGESPPQNRQTKRKSSFSSIMTNRRAISFRLSVPTNQNEEEQCTNCNRGLMNSTTGIQNINEEEELQRLAGLQIRESLIRGMGMSEQLRTMLDSQPSSRIQTPIPQQRGGQWMDDNNRYEGGREYPSRYDISMEGYSQTSLHNVTMATTHSSYATYTSPSHRITGGAKLHHLPVYRLQRNKSGTDRSRQQNNSFNQVGVAPNQTSPLGHTLPHHQIPPPPSLELYGYSIPTIPYKADRHYHDNSYRNRLEEHRLGVQGHSITNRVKQIKYLSLPQRTS